MEELKIKIAELFKRHWDIELTETEECTINMAACAILDQYGWNNVFSVLEDYLTEYVKTPEQAINAAHIFWEFQWNENVIPDPYKFLAYFYYRINFETEKYDDSDILDSLAITILPNNGYPDADLVINPYYMPENDPKMKAAVDEWTKKLYCYPSTTESH